MRHRASLTTQDSKTTDPRKRLPLAFWSHIVYQLFGSSGIGLLSVFCHRSSAVKAVGYALTPGLEDRPFTLKHHHAPASQGRLDLSIRTTEPAGSLPILKALSLRASTPYRALHRQYKYRSASRACGASASTPISHQSRHEQDARKAWRAASPRSRRRRCRRHCAWLHAQREKELFQRATGARLSLVERPR